MAETGFFFHKNIKSTFSTITIYLISIVGGVYIYRVYIDVK